MPRDEVRLGFAGAGGFARTVMAPLVHACPGLVLQAVGARDEARGLALEPAGRVHASYQALVEDPDVDAVYVVLSNDLHAEVAEMALRAGKHVLCEKPLALSRAQAESMVAVAAAADRLLLEGFWYLWHPRQRALLDFIASGALGDVRAIDSGFVFEADLDGNYRLDGARGGGAAYDVLCYALSFAVAALGDRAPLSVELEAVERGALGADLSTRADFDFGDGALASLSGGFTGPDGRWGTVVGSQATAVMGQPCFSWAPEPDEGTLLTVQDLEGAVLDTLHFPPADPRTAMLAGFADVVSGRAQASMLPVSAAHSLAVMTGLDLVHRAMGRAV